MVKNLRHIGIVVQDLDVCSDFFIKTLGFKVKKEALEEGPFIEKILAMEGASLTTLKMVAPDNSMVELLKFHSHSDSKKEWGGSLHTTGLTHVAFTVENIDESYKILSDMGVIFNSSPQLSPDGGAKVAFCKGPENLFIELVEEMK